MSWLTHILSKCVLPSKRITPSNRPPIKLRLEFLEERCCPSTTNGVCETTGTLGGNVNTGITFSNASWNTSTGIGMPGFMGTVKNGNLSKLSDGIMGQTYSTTGGLSMNMTGGSGAGSVDASGRFSGSFTVKGAITIQYNMPGVGIVPTKMLFEGVGDFFGTDDNATGDVLRAYPDNPIRR